ncbi:MAG: choice-of-anchor Q domain-containing protein [bacterium]
MKINGCMNRICRTAGCVFVQMAVFIVCGLPVGSEPSLNALVDACEYLNQGDIPTDSFQSPENAIYVAIATDGGDDANSGTSIDGPFEHLDKAIEYANAHAETPLTIYLRGGTHYYKSLDMYQEIQRGNLYVTAYPNEEVTIRPFYWPGNPTEWGDEHAFVFVGPYENITFDNLHVEGWSVVFYAGSSLNTSPMRNLTIKNITASGFTRRGGESGWLRVFLETDYVQDDVYGEGKVIFSDPDAAHYQIENLILSNISVQDVDLGINIGDENDANVKGTRITHFNVENPSAASGDSASDAFAIVNSYRILIDHCRIVNINDDGIDTKSYDVAVINTYIQGTGRNAVKFWRNGELINSILYDVTAINDGAIIVEEGPFRMVNSVLLRHTVGYAGTFDYEGVSQTANKMEVVNSVFGEVKGFYVGTTDLRAYNNRYFNILDDAAIISGQVDAENAEQLNTLPNCSGNATSTSQFVNPSAETFSLISGSEWIDAGMSQGVLLPSFDYYGNARVVGSAIDIGPIEYGSTIPSPTPQPTGTPSHTPTRAPTDTPTPTPAVAPSLNPQWVFTLDSIDEFDCYPGGFIGAPAGSVVAGEIPQGTDDFTDGHGIIVTTAPGQVELLVFPSLDVGESMVLIRASVQSTAPGAAVALAALDGSMDGSIATNIPANSAIFQGNYQRLTLIYNPPGTTVAPVFQIANRELGQNVTLYLDNVEVYLISKSACVPGYFLYGE